ncbi:MAG: outer membrane lipid asymmetry maintenance protein MlaD [Candidatus Binatia bacterium]|nr:outer membrane lipid asymmetry maintenance protein MlaD [Candidatus Binatia bacterium]
MNRSPRRDLIVGLFVLAGLAALAYLSMNVGGLTFHNQGGLTLYASFDEIGGLKPRAPVVIAGVKVGQVVDIILDNDYRARVRMDLRRELKLPVDTSASIVTAGLLGDQYISLQVGGEDRYLENGGVITITESALSLERLIGKFIYSLDRGGGNNANSRQGASGE